MPGRKLSKQQESSLSGRLWVRVGLGLVVIALLAGLPGAWALPNQSPDYQTVPTLTPTPTPPSGATATPITGPTSTPGTRPTATPVSQPPTATPPSSETPQGPTETPATSVPEETAPAPTATPAPILPAQCWTFPTPGFAPVQAATLRLTAQSLERLVVPGQRVSLRWIVTNEGNGPARNVLLCAPLPSTLVPGQPVATRGRASLERQGVIAELGDLPRGEAAEVSIELTIPDDHPLGEVIESQAWVFAGETRASTELLSWALPPAWLPPTGLSSTLERATEAAGDLTTPNAQIVMSGHQ